MVRGLMTRGDNVALLSATSLPVMFIYGDADVYSPLSRIKQIQADLPNCRHEIIPGTGHNTHVENPRAVYELVSSLL